MGKNESVVTSYVQCNFSNKNNVVFEEQAFWKLVRENHFTSDWSFFDRPIVGVWKVKPKHKYYDHNVPPYGSV